MFRELMLYCQDDCYVGHLTAARALSELRPDCEYTRQFYRIEVSTTYSALRFPEFTLDDIGGDSLPEDANPDDEIVAWMWDGIFGDWPLTPIDVSSEGRYCRLCPNEETDEDPIKEIPCSVHAALNLSPVHADCCRISTEHYMHLSCFEWRRLRRPDSLVLVPDDDLYTCTPSETFPAKDQTRFVWQSRAYRERIMAPNMPARYLLQTHVIPAAEDSIRRHIYAYNELVERHVPSAKLSLEVLREGFAPFRNYYKQRITIDDVHMRFIHCTDERDREELVAWCRLWLGNGARLWKKALSHAFVAICMLTLIETAPVLEVDMREQLYTFVRQRDTTSDDDCWYDLFLRFETELCTTLSMELGSIGGVPADVVISSFRDVPELCQIRTAHDPDAVCSCFSALLSKRTDDDDDDDEV